MRVPPDLPVRLPPRAEAPVPLSEVIAADAPEWESASDALDAAAASAADDFDSGHDHDHDHEQDESSARRRPDWAEPEAEDETPPGEHLAARRPELGSGFWVLPDPRTYLPRVAAPGRARLIADVAPALSTDLAGRRQSRREQNARDDDEHLPPEQRHRGGSTRD